MMSEEPSEHTVTIGAGMVGPATKAAASTSAGHTAMSTPTERATTNASAKRTSTNMISANMSADYATAGKVGANMSLERASANTSMSMPSERVDASAPVEDAPADPSRCCGCAGAQAALEEMPDEELLYDLADLFKVFADTTRIKILYALMGTDLCVADLAEAVGASQSAVSHQLRTLKQARLVRFRREGKNVIYALADDHVYTMLSQGMSHICE